MAFGWTEPKLRMAEAGKRRREREKKRVEDSKKSKRGRPAKPKAVIVEPEGGLVPEECEAWLRKTLAMNLPGMVRMFIEDGSASRCRQMQTVLQLLREGEDAAEALGRRLMEEMGAGEG